MFHWKYNGSQTITTQKLQLKITTEQRPTSKMNTEDNSGKLVLINIKGKTEN